MAVRGEGFGMVMGDGVMNSEPSVSSGNSLPESGVIVIDGTFAKSIVGLLELSGNGGMRPWGVRGLRFWGLKAIVCNAEWGCG